MGQNNPLQSGLSKSAKGISAHRKRVIDIVGKVNKRLKNADDDINQNNDASKIKVGQKLEQKPMVNINYIV